MHRINAEDKRQKEGKRVESTSQQREYIMCELQEICENDKVISKKKYLYVEKVEGELVNNEDLIADGEEASTED